VWSCVAAWAVSSSHPAQVHWAPGSCPALLFLLWYVAGVTLVGLQACKQRRCLLFILHNQTTTLL
jgi:hypothetical protein